MVLSLPPIPPELKPIAPYLQRADEIAANDPVISYWCAYYAAQQGIALKVKESSARHFLFDLLGLLEKLKNDIGANDAVHDEPASAAYVENFALRVFTGADNEDRRSKITKNTARKFLAAANFLEILRTFDSEKTAIDLPAIEEKIKYAKWKAAEIAKAFREGRTPTPGPAGSAAVPQDELPPALPDIQLPDFNVVPPPETPPAVTSSPPSLPSPPSIVRTHPPPPELTDLSPVDHSDHLVPHLPDGLAPPQPPQSPGSWSTAATPGTPSFQMEDTSLAPSESAYSPPGSAGVTRGAYVSGGLEGMAENGADEESTPPSSAAKLVHFSPSTVGGAGEPEDAFANPSLPPPPSAPPFEIHPPSSDHTFVSMPTRATDPLIPPVVPSPTSHVHAHSVPLATIPVPDTTVTTMPVELSPQVIARVQKHCRFAISALDYEDKEQAVKELRAALRMLGG
uniref:N/A n=1 Tax=Ganoderma boninense TaxID=34458 RepID=A0A5K1JS58_9APHY|nr:N/A [Ganoderma boninense]